MTLVSLFSCKEGGKNMAEVITVANHKGGRAKTVTTLNLGYALKELGYKVLLVDLDSHKRRL